MPNVVEPSVRVNRGPAAGPENRRALIAAAREVYAEAGLSAPFSQVAKRAGVGQGSLYRHFPDRTALAVAVFEENIGDLEAFASDPERTIDDFLDLVADQAVVSTAFIELLSADVADPRVKHIGARYREAVELLLERQAASGRTPEGFDVDDVLVATDMLAAVIARTPPEGRADVAARARRLVHSAFRPATR
ncbi:TetR/AcrR family transcriptional regulator [Microbacterium sp. B2969]|uniref:TetR/AcrR family transcriptional regulator n=1 Tax=Microbacterium alkaliflavum TaxID=3248839 RepID=A0ABW7QBH2_9MICO